MRTKTFFLRFPNRTCKFLLLYHSSVQNVNAKLLDKESEEMKIFLVSIVKSADIHIGKF